MGNLKTLLLLLNLLAISLLLKAQTNHSDRSLSTSNTLYPKFTDAGKFMTDFKNKIDFKSIYKTLRRYSISDAYLYNFEVTKEGRVIPERNLTDNNRRLKKINTFVKEAFNNYRWTPGYEKNRKETSHLVLCVFLYTDIKKINVFIEIRKTNKKIFSAEIPFNDSK